MKRILTFCVFLILIEKAFPQISEPVFVLLSGSGETIYSPANGFDYSHHTNYSMHLKSITAKWDLRLLMGEPVINGVFKWTAGEGTPADYLDYRDYVLLECTPAKSTGYLVYIKITPTVPGSGEGYGFNTAGSPSWKSVFCTRDGKEMTTKVPGFNAEKAREIWKNGFYITGLVLARHGGKDGFLNSSNETQLAETKKQDELIRKSKEKYDALKNPFSLRVRNNDTVYNNTIKPVQSLNPYFANAAVYLSIVNDEFTASATSVTTDMYLSPGWNKLIYVFVGKGIDIKDSLRIFYSKNEPYLLKDDFNDGLIDKKWTVNNDPEKLNSVKEENGALLLNYKGLINGPVLKVDPHRKLIIEVRSLSRGYTCYYADNVLININNKYGFRCRQNCNMQENARIVCDLINGSVECFVNGELIETYQKIDFKADEGIRVNMSCRYREKWEIDEMLIYQ